MLERWLRGQLGVEGVNCEGLDANLTPIMERTGHITGSCEDTAGQNVWEFPRRRHQFVFFPDTSL